MLLQLFAFVTFDVCSLTTYVPVTYLFHVLSLCLSLFFCTERQIRGMRVIVIWSSKSLLKQDESSELLLIRAIPFIQIIHGNTQMCLQFNNSMFDCCWLSLIYRKTVSLHTTYKLNIAKLYISIALKFLIILSMSTVLLGSTSVRMGWMAYSFYSSILSLIMKIKVKASRPRTSSMVFSVKHTINFTDLTIKNIFLRMNWLINSTGQDY